MTMPKYIRTTCGAQHSQGEQPLVACVTCEDDREYAEATGRQWTPHDELRLTNRTSIRFEDPTTASTPTA